MSNIDFDKVSEKQILEMKKAVLDYCYIMKQKELIKDNNLSQDFKDIYYDYYLKASHIKFPKNGDAYNTYFEILSNNLSDGKNTHKTSLDELKKVICSLKSITKNNQFSVATKMLHTVNPDLPIYDKKVREYLSANEKNSKGKQFPKTVIGEKAIYDYWEELIVWYSDNKAKKSDWINWFDRTILNNKNKKSITAVKKIDFIIFILGNQITKQSERDD